MGVCRPLVPLRKRVQSAYAETLFNYLFFYRKAQSYICGLLVMRVPILCTYCIWKLNLCFIVVIYSYCFAVSLITTNITFLCRTFSSVFSLHLQYYLKFGNVTQEYSPLSLPNHIDLTVFNVMNSKIPQKLMPSYSFNSN